ncbi:MAG: TlpA family protein disulfide reductase [Opitutus sp.]|nr:TlpA family protein disulfide reductase [Opitutus sp.]
MNLRFWRADDGRLYVHNTSHAVGGVLLVVPTLISTEVWSRWEPATPEALQRQAAAFAKQTAAREHAAELNRLRATVGAPAPAFAGTDVLSGRPVTNADFAGKVVVVHAWSTDTGPSALKPLHAAYEKYHTGGMEIIGLCRNSADQRQKVVDFIKSHKLTWPQFYDGRGTHGEIFEAYYGARAIAPICVIDRHGNVTALVTKPAELDATVAAALAVP